MDSAIAINSQQNLKRKLGRAEARQRLVAIDAQLQIGWQAEDCHALDSEG